ncbi:MAG: hypothetical protein ACMX3H_10325 [Sodalis sp. (in: enterobacteria)]|uniref:hypothetical protein n=1 Tax=Sodalis sp. (in: enterobacteria) TaxID=1898979 RepID=UPI0039E4BC43
MEHIFTGLYNKPTNNSRRPPRGAYLGSTITTPYAGNVLTIQVLTSTKNEVQHNLLVKQVLGTVAFH